MSRRLVIKRLAARLDRMDVVLHWVSGVEETVQYYIMAGDEAERSFANFLRAFGLTRHTRASRQKRMRHAKRPNGRRNK